MQARSPHFLLFSEAVGQARRPDAWRFVLQSIGGRHHLSAEDTEPGVGPSRLELLAVVRGLEALDGPARVTLVTRSSYVARGIRRGLVQWRVRGWRWERFGQLVPIRDADLWQRVDRAMRFHDVDFCGWHMDEIRPTHAAAAPHPAEASPMFPTDDVPESAEVRRKPKVAACHARENAPGPALVIVERHARRRRAACHAHHFALAQALEKLRQNVLSPLAALCRPAFTRAA